MRNRCRRCSTPTSSKTPSSGPACEQPARSSPSASATPAEHLAVVVLEEMPDEDDPDAVRAWAPSAAFRDAVRSVALATLALYVGIVETLADEADRDDGDGETMH